MSLYLRIRNKHILYVGGFLIILSLIMFLTPYRGYSPIVSFLGAILFFSSQQQSRKKTDKLVVNRLMHIQQIGDILLVISSILMSMSLWNWGIAKHGEWLLVLTISAWIELYTVFRLDSVQKGLKDKL